MSADSSTILDIPLPPGDGHESVVVSEMDETVLTAATTTTTASTTPFGVATPFKGSFTTQLSTPLTSPTLYDPQAAAYYHAYQSVYSTTAQMAAPHNTMGYPYYYHPVVPMQQSAAVAALHAATAAGMMATVGAYSQQVSGQQEQQRLVAAVSAAASSKDFNAFRSGKGRSSTTEDDEEGENEDEEEEDEEEDPTVERKKGSKLNNTLPIWGNEKTMNLNPLILTNIQNSPYFKVKLFALKTYHEVIDEIWYEVKHLEPWEKGSRRVGGQTGMCGSVRGVGAGGIVSTPFCILYKLYTLRLTRKQVVGLMRHKDSPYIRVLGFMYVRYTQPPEHLWSWFQEYLDDDEEVEVKAGGGQKMTIGQIVRHMLTKLDWFSTLFPRIPVPVQKVIEKNMKAYEATNNHKTKGSTKLVEEGEFEEEADESGETSVEHHNHYNKNGHGSSHKGSRSSSGYKEKRKRSRSRSVDRQRGKSRHSRSHSTDRDGRRRRDSRSRSRERSNGKRSDKRRGYHNHY